MIPYFSDNGKNRQDLKYSLEEENSELVHMLNMESKWKGLR